MIKLSASEYKNWKKIVMEEPEKEIVFIVSVFLGIVLLLVAGFIVLGLYFGLSISQIALCLRRAFM